MASTYMFSRVEEIFSTRGYEAAMVVAQATADSALLRRVNFLQKQEIRKQWEARHAPRHPGATDKARASGKLARREANRASRDAECQARKGASSGGQNKKKQ